jgi:hypothetical protein
MHNSLRVAGLAALLLTVSARASAHDLEGPHEHRQWSAAALLGYGFDFEEAEWNPFGFALGLRGGYTLDQGLYLGGQLMYFGGDSFEAPGIETSVNLVTVGIEGGFDIWVEPVTIRPSLGLGLAFLNTSVESTVIDDDDSVDNSSTNLYLAPGVTVIYPLDEFFVGGDARIWFVTEDPSITGMTLMATAGAAF